MKQGLHIMLQRLVRSTRQNRASSVANGGRAVVMDVRILGSREIPPVETTLQDRGKPGIDGEDVLVGPMLHALLADEDSTRFFHDGRGNLGRSPFEELAELPLSSENRLSHLDHAPGAERIRFPRPSERWLRPFAALEERRPRPARSDRRAFRNPLVHRLERFPGHTRGAGERLRNRATHRTLRSRRQG